MNDRTVETLKLGLKSSTVLKLKLIINLIIKTNNFISKLTKNYQLFLYSFLLALLVNNKDDNFSECTVFQKTTSVSMFLNIVQVTSF